MKYEININTKLEINNLKELSKLKKILEVNNLEKPNFSKLGRELGVDRRTVKKYYEGNYKKERKKRKSKLSKYEEIIRKLLNKENTARRFYYKIHLYRYMVREYNINCSRSNFNYYILQNKEFSEYFKTMEKKEAIKSEKPFGKQAQFDWKEKIKFTYSNGKTEIINVGSLVLSASRFKIWMVYPSTKQEYLFDFLTNAFEKLGGVPRELLIDNAKTMMDIARTEKNKGKVNIRFQQFADDFGFKIISCIRARPNTKAKVENPMRILDEIRNYSGELKNIGELQEKLNQITEEANMRICQSTDIPPILLLKKEKEHILPLPNDKICSNYKAVFKKAKVKSNSLFKYKKNEYSVPPELIGKDITIYEISNQLYVYYNKKLVTMHQISEKKINYREEDHLKMIEKTFPNKENIVNFALEHLKELERFNEQLSKFN